MLWLLNAAVALLANLHVVAAKSPFKDALPRYSDIWGPLLTQWDQPFDADHRKQLASQAADMFSHAYNSYMKHGYPADNVKPKSCQSEDVQGGVALTLLDSLDALLIFGKADQFKAAADLVEHQVAFNSSGEVHVFELTIRAMGGLLSAHIATTQQPSLVPGYSGAFLAQARALADRLLPAFDTPTAIPLSWISLSRGQLPGTVRSTCLACATTLTLEFRLLSHLTGDARYGAAVDAAVAAVYARRHPRTGLLGNTLSTDTGQWERGDAGIGPGADSFYEYLLKTYLVFGDERYLGMFAEQYTRVQRFMAVPGRWRGAAWVLDVSMGGLGALKQWVSSLSAFWPGVQASVGQVDAAQSLMSEYIRAQLRYGWLPEQIHYHLDAVHPQEVGYPLRPEVIESAYVLWSTTREPRYLRVAEGMLGVLRRFNRCDCGYCAVRNITSGELDDSMESFFLAETSKYLYLLLSNATAVNDFFVFSTEGHLLPVLPSAAEAASTAPPQPQHQNPVGGALRPPAGAGGRDSGGGGGRAEGACGDVCAETPLAELIGQARTAQAEFPSLTFDAEAAQRLRRRRCRACVVVQEHLTALPALPPCDAARRLGVPLDQPCTEPPPDTSDEASAKFAAAVRDIQKLQAKMAAAFASLVSADDASGASAPQCAAPADECSAAPAAGPPMGAVYSGARGEEGPLRVPVEPRGGSSCNTAADSPTADPVTRPSSHAVPSGGAAAGSMQSADPSAPGFKPKTGLASPFGMGGKDGEGSCSSGGPEAGGLSGSDVAAYALCLLWPMVTSSGMLHCIQMAVVSAASLPVNLLPALLPARVLIAEAALQTPRHKAVAVTLSVKAEGGCGTEGEGARVMAVLRAAGAAFGPELPRPRGPVAEPDGREAAVLRGDQFLHAMGPAAGCGPVHAWLRGMGGDGAAGGCCDAAGSGNASSGFRGADGEGAPLGGRLVVAAPGDACHPLQPPSSGNVEGGSSAYEGAVVVAHRGGCMFLEKVLNAQAGGARGIVIVNSAPHPGCSAMSGDCYHADGAEQDEEDDSRADVFFMYGPEDHASEPREDLDIPAAMVSYADGHALIAALSCMQNDDACELCSWTHEAEPGQGCARWRLTADLTTDVEQGHEGGGDADGSAGGSSALYDVSWKLLSHPALANDIQQLAEEVGIHDGSGWDHAMSAFIPHLTTLIEGWLQRSQEANV